MPTVKTSSDMTRAEALQQATTDRKARNMSFYNSARWRRTSKNYLNHNPFCEQCQRDDKVSEARHTDHIIPIADGGNKYSHDNLQALCVSCHSKKTRKEQLNSDRAPTD